MRITKDLATLTPTKIFACLLFSLIIENIENIWAAFARKPKPTIPFTVPKKLNQGKL
jgi:hypothetical protein